MKLSLNRITKTNKSTIGALFVDGVFECYTLEDVFREVPSKPVCDWKIDGKTAIPTGTYKVIINKSNRFKRLMPLLIGVPGFDGIRIHSGNKAEDTEGCILVGTTKAVDWVSGSRDAFASLFAKMEKADSITITIA